MPVKQQIGVVISTKMQKTIVVKIENKWNDCIIRYNWPPTLKMPIYVFQLHDNKKYVYCTDVTDIDVAMKKVIDDFDSMWIVTAGFVDYAIVNTNACHV